MLARRAAARIAAQARASRSLYALAGPGLPSTLPSAVTVLVDAAPRTPTALLQQAVLKGVGEGIAQAPAATSHDAAVVLVSPEFWAWLDDDGFVSQLLNAAGARPHAHSGAITLLAAAVQGVPRGVSRLGPFSSSEGISILCGDSTELLPAVRRHGSGPRPDASQPPSLEFRSPTARNGAFKSVRLPLANTLFTLGKPNPLVTSMWGPGDGHRLRKISQDTEKVEHTVVLRKPGRVPEASSFVQSSANLIALTKPHRVLSSFGNVLSKIWANSQQTPPSEELEAIIPRLLKARASVQGDGAPPPAAVGVWALTIPERVVTVLSRTRGVLEPLDLAPSPGVAPYDGSSEQRLARASAWPLRRLLWSGCRLSKVLSGGGGWGAKRGLLALDPQHTIGGESAEEEAAFRAALIGKTKQGRSPDSDADSEQQATYVQFLVEPVSPISATTPAAADEHPPAPLPAPINSLTTLFGTPGGETAPPPPFPTTTTTTPHSLDPTVTPIWNLFGGASSTGLFLAEQQGPPPPLGGSNLLSPKKPAEGEVEGAKGGGWATKLDVPGSFIEAYPLKSVPKYSRTRGGKVDRERGLVDEVD
ncbi:hypothetical protein C8A05DRAFT_37533 [Staphylotrichum tortipilum]|uniref:Uncharacterized protein n=1 Tax=Staphylotrichum tortipilum TaxID=2831512 RepID=A0AAN6MES1_9PEZI|nr:hypothetical protein C8A05DRAFT_37533 [Staphylotrichum longicolle]